MLRLVLQRLVRQISRDQKLPITEQWVDSEKKKLTKRDGLFWPFWGVATKTTTSISSFFTNQCIALNDCSHNEQTVFKCYFPKKLQWTNSIQILLPKKATQGWGARTIQDINTRNATSRTSMNFHWVCTKMWLIKFFFSKNRMQRHSVGFITRTSLSIKRWTTGKQNISK